MIFQRLGWQIEEDFDNSDNVLRRPVHLTFALLIFMLFIGCIGWFVNWSVPSNEAIRFFGAILFLISIRYFWTVKRWNEN